MTRLRIISGPSYWEQRAEIKRTPDKPIVIHGEAYRFIPKAAVQHRRES